MNQPSSLAIDINELGEAIFKLELSLPKTESIRRDYLDLLKAYLAFQKKLYASLRK